MYQTSQAFQSSAQSLPVCFSVMTYRNVSLLVIAEKYRIGDILHGYVVNQYGQQVRCVNYVFCRPTTLYLVASRFQGRYYLVEYSKDLCMPVCSCRERAYGWCSHCQKVADMIGLSA